MQALLELWIFITAWYNLPFTLALLAFLALSALQFLGLDHDHDADAEADLHLEVEHDLDLDHDLDIDHDLDLDHDADLDHGLEHDIGHDAAEIPAWAGLLHFLGVGQAPITMILLVLLGSFGLLGWIINSVAINLLPAYPGWAFLLVLVVVLLISAWFTSQTARFIGRALPAFATTAVSVKRLVGLPGRVISPQIDQTYGQVKLRDSGGTLHTVFAVVDPGKPPLPRDTQVYLVEYDEAKKVFIVVSAE